MSMTMTHEEGQPDGYRVDFDGPTYLDGEKSKGHRWWLLTVYLLVGILLATVALAASMTRLHRTSATKALLAPPPANDSPTPLASDQGVSAPPIPISASRLRKEYRTNALAADSKYKGRLLHVEASIAWSNKDLLDRVVLHLRAGGSFTSIAATMDEVDAKRAARLKRGEPVVLLCKCSNEARSVSLHDCRLRQ